MPDDLDVPIEPLPFTYMSTGTETRFKNGLDPDARTRDVFAVHRPDTLAAWAAEHFDKSQAPTLRHRLQLLPDLNTDRALAGAGRGDPQPRGLARREPPARADPDGDRLRQDVHRREHRLPPHPLRRREADPVPRRSREPRPPDAEGVPGLRCSGRGPQVHRALQRPAPRFEHDRPGRARDDLDHPAALLDAEGRDGAGRGAGRGVGVRGAPRRAGVGRLQPAGAARDVRRRDRRRVPPLDLRALAPGARLLRRFHDRPHRDSEQAGFRFLQAEPGHGVQPRSRGHRQRQRRLRRLPDPHRDQRAWIERRGRSRNSATEIARRARSAGRSSTTK